PEQVVDAALQGLGENQVVCVPGFINQAIAAFVQSGMSHMLMGILARYFRSREKNPLQPEGYQNLLACPECHPKLAQAGAGGRLPNQSIYRFYAPVYDLLFGPLYATQRRRTAELLSIQPGERLLISGVGSGLDLPLVQSGAIVTGIDISAEMLRQAAQKSSPAQVSLARMDAQRLDFADGSFDAALLNLIVSVAPDGRAVFQEAWRVLRPGGRLVLLDKFAPEKQPIGPLRSALGSLIRLLGTDVNRKLSEVVGDLEDGVVEVNEPSLMGGMYRILRFRKHWD
ncbi:MAG: methyltransferase domain-containing protein, partial [Anaerolineaceae bacterium]|nr:methyltransferase domain-containing protein [Anaerolineaceae bacterium]